MAERPNGDCYTTDDLPYLPIPLSPPTLSEIAGVLHYGMQPLFHEVNVDVVSCPCLTGPPYNLAGVGLCGNASVVKYDSENSEGWNHRTKNIRDILTTSCRDSFIIGSTYATKPYMPYYGHLIVNATYRAPNDIRNESRIIFANKGDGQTKIEKLTNSDHMIFTDKGTFFVCEALGGVLRMKNGRVACNVMWDEYEEPMPLFDDFVKQLQCPEIDLESDMVAVGTILNEKPQLLTDQEQRYGLNLYNRSEFHCFSNYEAGGQFISDTTPDTTEYEGYFNVAEQMNLIEDVTSV
ncbi:ester hydrolase C11orf54 homolog [Mycetomoellerius zeteki]|uniref:ester hydrolase C11orf54 homolog n=1 Tax=Mycetomoellerius zeteki TaxID=64791 RepID=UPI00084EC08C|nr:PREDICTED: ester hydrolase C11orf54 homolog [Trachymyrmex zeteki]